MLFKEPFTLAEAEANGLSRSRLRGPTWRRVDRGIYVRAELTGSEVTDLAAVLRRLPPSTVFAGRTAAWLHELDGRLTKPLEVNIPRAEGIAARSGVRVFRDALTPDEAVERQGFPTTSVVRTLVDLSRRQPLVEAVEAADVALHRGAVSLAELEGWAARHPRASGVARLRKVVELAEPRAESPMETRLRLLLVLSGLRRPEAQVAVTDSVGRIIGRLDLCYPDLKIAIEYDGGTHRESLVEDNRRQNRLVEAGFYVLRITAADLLGRPALVVEQVRAALKARQLARWSTNGRVE